MMTQKQRKPRQKKVHWQDALKQFQAKEEMAATRQRHWTRLYTDAATDMQAEGAVVFLGEETLSLLRQTATPDDEAPPRITRPPLPLMLAGGAALAASLASYALSYARVAAQMR
jgi:hypothetical protein